MSTQPATPSPTGPLNGIVSAFTTANLVLIAVVMVLVVIGILYGSRLRRERRDARLAEERRIAEFGGSPPPPSPEPATTAAGIGQPPVAPVPAPAAGSDEPAPAADVFGTAPAVRSDAPAEPPPSPQAEPERELTQLKGLGPRAAARLAELGVTRLSQLAQLDEDAAERLDAQMGTFRGRLTRDRWVEQARFLAAGDRAGFEAVFGKL